MKSADLDVDDIHDAPGLILARRLVEAEAALREKDRETALLQARVRELEAAVAVRPSWASEFQCPRDLDCPSAAYANDEDHLDALCQRSQNLMEAFERQLSN